MSHRRAYFILSILVMLTIITSIDIAITTNRHFTVEAQKPDPSTSSLQPQVIDPKLKVELVYSGNGFPTNMAFIGKDDILLLSKKDGDVLRIKDGKNIGPILHVNVNSKDERGLLGIATDAYSAKNPFQSGIGNVFLYYSVCQSKIECNNFVYKYDWMQNEGKLTNPKLLLKLPGSPGPSHQGGDMTIGPDGNIYLVIGDMLPTDLFNKDKKYNTQAQNYEDGVEPDGRAGILTITKDGKPVDNGIGSAYPLNLYYAYGIKNSFGIGFDPVTGKLWDTENGPDFGDEINLIEPGFNGGWSKIQGFWAVSGTSEKMQMISGEPTGLIDFGGKGKYYEPKLVWDKTVAPTALVFLSSTNLGSQYKNDMFVGSVKDGTIFHLKLTEDRTDLLLPNTIKNKIVVGKEDEAPIVFAKNFGIVTDLQVGPDDGYLYVVSGNRADETGAIYRIVPK